MEPITAHDWQMAVDAASALLSIEAARDYGLIVGGPDVDLVRCEEIIGRGAARGIVPSSDAPSRYVGEWNAEARRVLQGEEKRLPSRDGFDDDEGCDEDPPDGYHDE